jgi:hypothetical protein
MKKIIYLILILLCSLSCKQKQSTKNNLKPTDNSLSTAQKIANAHGFEQWKNVNDISFTFAEKRSWIWKPKTNDVALITDKDTINYNRKAMDSITMDIDKAFINDKFWLLIPFQLVWDTGAKISEPVKTESPIHKVFMPKITLTYPNKGGYTPGDAYDIYYDDNYIIKEWVFRKGNQAKPSLANTFEKYKNFNGLILAEDHKKGNNDWNLKLTNIRVVLENY